jgi:hypothetical protein
MHYAAPSLTPRSRTHPEERLSAESKEVYGQRLNLVVHVSIRKQRCRDVRDVRL